jgi:Chitobiase/beta-hexosaminidase C-terminal domain
VTLSADDGGSGVAQIKYTTDGTDPSPVNGTVYSGAFALPSTATVKFRAYDQVGN